MTTDRSTPSDKKDKALGVTLNQIERTFGQRSILRLASPKQQYVKAVKNC